MLGSDGRPTTVASGTTDGKAPMPELGTFRVASVTKTFVAAAALRLVEEGSLDLDAMAIGLLPAATARELRSHDTLTGATVRHLLSHTSGLADHSSDARYRSAVLADPGRVWTPHDQLAIALSAGNVAGAPGTRFLYSDTGYVLLGQIIERATRTALAGAVRSLIDFDRLGLRSTFWESAEPVPPDAPSALRQYFGTVDIATFDPSLDLFGGGGLVSTTEDLARFAYALFDGNVFAHPGTLDVMLGPFPSAAADGQGMGITRLPGGWWGHTGFWGTVMAHHPTLMMSVAAVCTQTPAAGGADPTPLPAHLVRDASQ